MENFLTILRKLQEQRGSVPTYILFDGITPSAWIEVEKALDKIPATAEKEVDIVLNSSGGTAEEAYKMIRAFRNKYETVNVVVPFWAKSAATLFSFGATRLVLHARGELGPIDAQIKKDDDKLPEGEISSALTVQASLAQIEKRAREGMLEMFTQFRNQSIDSESGSDIARIGRTQLAEMLLNYSAKFYTPLIQNIDPIEMGKMARVLDIGRMYARRILKQYGKTPDTKIDDLLLFLVYECPDHGYVVDYDILKSFLSFVIRADEEPFDQSYYKHLGDLSLLLMTTQPWPKINGFLSSFPPPSKSANIQLHGTDNQQSTKNLKTGGSSSRSSENFDKENAPTESKGSNIPERQLANR